MRDEYWDTQPAYGGDQLIWDALKAAAEADLGTAKLIIDSAGIIVSASDMTVCYDERGDASLPASQGDPDPDLAPSSLTRQSVRLTISVSSGCCSILPIHPSMRPVPAAL
jgi:Ubiquitin-binding domain